MSSFCLSAGLRSGKWVNQLATGRCVLSDTSQVMESIVMNRWVQTLIYERDGTVDQWRKKELFNKLSFKR